MKHWVLTPHDTLVLRDGRELEGTATPIRSMELPWPSTIAGFARTRRWNPPGASDEERQEHAQQLLREVQVRGPWLAVEERDGQHVDLAVPAPQDCLWHRSAGGALERRRLVPLDRNGLGLCDLSDDHAVVGLDDRVSSPAEKPTPGPPYWYWSDVRRWLVVPSAFSECDAGFGIQSLAHEARNHVSIAGATKTAAEGMLFRTDHVRYRLPGGRVASVAFLWDAGESTGGVGFVGGERRLSTLRQVELSAVQAPTVPGEWDLDGATRLRVVLLTPAYFAEGSVPKTIHGATVLAACVGRPVVVSGWDYLRGCPKHTRRLAPAGSVYWIQVEAGAAKAFVEQHWLRSVAPADTQDQRDGYGVAVMGVA